ncbi:MAG: molybdopterin-dependent oxidoreductase [Bacteroidia bacterium]|nr:molybdopterin-dependent oxidoreductase [Bacteroidia bacterium]
MKKTVTNENGSLKSLELSGMKRRDFFKLLGGGIFIFFQPWDPFELFDLQTQQRRSLPTEFNAFLQIAEDGTVNCYTSKMEMGQGAITSLAQIMADEIEVPFEKVKMVMGDTDLCPWDGGTNGSQTIRSFSPRMRVAAAEAKTILMQLGSGYLHVPVSQLEVKDGIISEIRNNKNKVSYGELAKGKKIEKHLDGKPELKDYTKFKFVGKPYLHQDARIKVTGEARYSADIQLPGLLHARLLRPPSHGAKLLTADISEAEKIKGIQVVRDGDLIAVLSDDRDKVDQAIVKVKAEFSFNEIEVDDKTIFDRILKANSEANVIRSNGDLETGKRISDSFTESEFHNSYVAHSTIEPHAATAMIEADKITVWVSTQQPFRAQETISREMNVPLEKVRIITPFVGGGFGGKSAHGQAVEAVKLAKITGKPVVVAWTRQEEFFYDTFRPAAVVKITSGMNKSDMIPFWDYNTYYAGARGADTIYDIPNAKTTNYSGGSVHPFGTGAWRAPGNNTNTFARESQINIMASKAGIDQLDFRIKNLKDEKMIAVLKAAADKFGYTPAKNPSGRGYGVACGIDVGTLVAHIAEVNVDKNTGHIQVIRVVCAQDMGLCVNPQGTTIQMEGCITMGLGYALTEEIQFQGGDIKNHSFDTYEIPRFSWVPKIDTVIMDRKDQAPQGGGEPTIICMGAVIANAVFDATGVRLYQLPMTPERVLAALKKV